MRKWDAVLCFCERSPVGADGWDARPSAAAREACQSVVKASMVLFWA